MLLHSVYPSVKCSSIDFIIIPFVPKYNCCLTYMLFQTLLMILKSVVDFIITLVVLHINKSVSVFLWYACQRSQQRLCETPPTLCGILGYKLTTSDVTKMAFWLLNLDCPFSNELSRIINIKSFLLHDLFQLIIQKLRPFLSSSTTIGYNRTSGDLKKLAMDFGK